MRLVFWSKGIGLKQEQRVFALLALLSVQKTGANVAMTIMHKIFTFLARHNLVRAVGGTPKSNLESNHRPKFPAPSAPSAGGSTVLDPSNLIENFVRVH
jgi:hypothetical protein